jgi:hypothetical protein|tara:strand:- start:17 stop:232 length:216 start_codon:yes stop_codon:yes gene_type:complete
MDALDWIFNDNQDFRDICFLARYDPEKVRLTATALLGMSPAKQDYHFKKIRKKSMRHNIQLKKEFALEINM